MYSYYKQDVFGSTTPPWYHYFSSCLHWACYILSMVLFLLISAPFFFGLTLKIPYKMDFLHLQEAFMKYIGIPVMFRAVFLTACTKLHWFERCSSLFLGTRQSDANGGSTFTLCDRDAALLQSVAGLTTSPALPEPHWAVVAQSNLLKHHFPHSSLYAWYSDSILVSTKTISLCSDNNVLHIRTTPKYAILFFACGDLYEQSVENREEMQRSIHTSKLLLQTCSCET